MANPERGEVAFVVGDREYTLRPTTNAIRQLQARTKKSYGQLLREVEGFDVESACQLLYAVLQPCHAKEFKTVDQVGDLIDEAGGVFAALTVLAQMLMANRPPTAQAGKESAANPPDEPAGTSGGSGLTLAASA